MVFVILLGSSFDPSRSDRIKITEITVLVMVSGGLLRCPFDLRFIGHKAFGKDDVVALDSLSFHSVLLQVGHRSPPLNAAYAEPMENVWHQLLNAHIHDTSHTFSAAKVLVCSVTTCLLLSGVVDEKLRHFPQSAAFFAVVDDDADAALLSGFDADLDAVDEVRLHVQISAPKTSEPLHSS